MKGTIVKYKKMDKAIKKQWLKALRSGEYKQARGYLCIEEKGEAKFCCLGVLYDATQDAWWEEREPKSLSRTYWAARAPKNSYKLGIYGNHILGMAVVDHLAMMNDNGKSFEQIANWIEKNL